MRKVSIVSGKLKFVINVITIVLHWSASLPISQVDVCPEVPAFTIIYMYRLYVPTVTVIADRHHRQFCL